MNSFADLSVTLLGGIFTTSFSGYFKNPKHMMQ